MLSVFLSIFFVKNYTNLSAKAKGALSMRTSWLVVYVTHHPELAIIFVGCGDCPIFLFLGIEIWPAGKFCCTGTACTGFMCSSNAFKQTLGVFFHNYGFVNPSQDVLHLGVFGV